MTGGVPAPVVEVAGTAWRNGEAGPGRRAIPEEVAIAVTYGRVTHAVMMATPADLEDFAVGFSLAEGIVAAPEEIVSIEPAAHPLGIDLRIELVPRQQDRFGARRRALAGPVGCGMCGIDSLAGAMRALPRISDATSFEAETLLGAVRTLPPLQPWNLRTRAMHAAAFWSPGEGIVAVREDIGRHNALDKLRGALARRGRGMGGGAALLTSRVSVDMVQKLAAGGCPLVVAVSAPTALAVRAAEEAGITLVAVARADGFEVFSHPGRIVFRKGARGPAPLPSVEPVSSHVR